MKKANLISLLFVFQVAVVASAQTFESNDQKAIAENVTYLRKNLKTVSDVNILKVAKYLSYIKLTPKMSNYKKDVSRLLESSMQFILCDSLENTACLEATPLIKPSTALRIDSLANLGSAVNAGDKLNVEYYFTSAWYENYKNKGKTFRLPEITVANRLAEKIKANDVKSIYFAMYGIDDIEGSMSSVFNAVKVQLENGVNIKAVVDVSDGTSPNDFIRDYDLVRNNDGTYRIVNMPGQLDLSYVLPENKSNWAYAAPPWAESFLRDAEKATAKMKTTEAKQYLLTKFVTVDKSFVGNADATLKDAVWLALNKKSATAEQTITRMAYQYNGTMDFMRLLNQRINSNDEALTHIESPYSGIMHNKFVIFEAGAKKSVWTGTANISQTCMGTENNANVSLFVKNDTIAQAFKDEFTEMFAPVKGKSEVLTGLFHNKKRPNTKRYFIFKDGTEVRVHFSPTDDAEHRVVLPLLYSARKGDQLRISMFGSGGYELVRALQAAAARGVNIKIAVDSFSGMGLGSWIKSLDANLLDSNPYVAKPEGSIEVRKSAWPGLNHHKTATLTRRLEDGSLKPETIIIGSQNWSAVGNDSNDENVVSITNKNVVLDIMKDYNQEFDQKIWDASVGIK